MTGRRRAFLIGNQLFRSDAGLEPLYGPRNDVAAMRRILANPERGGFEVEEFIDKGRDAILPTIEEALYTAHQDDLFLIYYAGHGRLDSAGRLCLATADTRSSAVYTTSVPTRHLCDLIRGSRCSTTVLILDCCYSGAVGSDLRGDVGSELSLATTVRGLHALTAATAIEAAKEMEEEEGGFPMGRFTAAMVRGIETGAADHDRDGSISVSDLVRYLEANVRGQTPQYWAHEATGNPVVAFVPAASKLRAGPAATAAPQDKAVQERRVRRLAYWFKQEKIQREDLDFLMAAALSEADSRVTILVQMILDLPSATPGALFAVWRDSDDEQAAAPLAAIPARDFVPAEPDPPAAAPEIDFDALIGDLPHAASQSAPIAPSRAQGDPFDDASPKADDGLFRSFGAGQAGSGLSVRRIGKYEVRRELSHSLFSTVFEGWDPAVHRRVAIKTLRLPDASDLTGREELVRFRREASAAGRLSHPNIVGVFNSGETDELAYVILEFIEGESLKAVLDRGDRLPQLEVVRIACEVLSGLQHSHERGIIHRDIKPSNVLLTEGQQAKINDFGIARIENSSLTQIGTVMGTPAYMAPEQFMGQTVDLRTDIYSSGVLLYQLLTGERPFDGSMTSIMHKALNVVPPKPSDLSVLCPAALDAVVSKAMAKRREDRYASASEFAAAIRAASAPAEPPPAAAEEGETLVAAAAAFSTALTETIAQTEPIARTDGAAETAPAGAGRLNRRAGLFGALLLVMLLVSVGAFVLWPHASPPPP